VKPQWGWWCIGKEDDAVLKPALKKIFEKGWFVLLRQMGFLKWAV
jgi:hypothetical protein